VTLADPLSLRHGECARVIVLRTPDFKRWDLAKLRTVDAGEDAILSEVAWPTGNAPSPVRGSEMNVVSAGGRIQ
jgi:hypothetical protein